MNNRNVFRFTEELYELLVKQNMLLDEALKIMAGIGKNEISMTAGEIAEELGNGCLFSVALAKNERIKFDEVYVLFVGLAEKTGNLGKAFEFLFKREVRRNENKEKLIEVLLYPCFVVIMAVAACVLLMVFGETLFCNEKNVSDEMKWSFMKSLFFLVCVSGIVFYVLWKNLKENKLYEAFLAVGFLISAGIGVSQAVGYGMLVVGPDSRYGRRFALAGRKLEYGMSLENAFDVSDVEEGRFGWRRERQIAEALYFTRCAGKKTDVFEKIAIELKRQDDKRRKNCLNLIEPVFICITGIFLLLLTVNLLLPFMSINSGW